MPAQVKTAGNWTLLRTLVAQVGETVAAPVAATFLGLVGPDPYNLPRKVEFSFQALTDVASGVAPTSVTFSFWRLSGPALDGNNVIELVNQTTITHANLLLQAPVIIDGCAAQFWVTVSFTGGTTPAIAGRVYARGLSS